MKTLLIRKKQKGKLQKESLGERIFDFFNVVFLIAISIIAVYPLWHVFCASFSDATAIMGKSGAILYPFSGDGSLAMNIDAYKKAFSHPLILTSYWNSILITGVATTINIILTALCAYVLSRKGMMLKKFFTVVITLTMFFGSEMIPRYIVYTKILNLYDSMWVLILPGAINVYNMIVMRTNFESIPESLFESARIDGAGHIKTLYRIVLPLSKPIIAVMVLYYAVAHWNDWFDASIFLQDRNKFPLQLVLREILIQNDTASMNGASDVEGLSETIKYATMIIATVPILCVYPYLQKYFTKGVMVGAVKG
ncbi:MAG: carbohydrate ABC transporter permease [Clostridia bacterium]|nr:carbohydrate ABC transporter permease [Clostridia bacterium]